MHAKKISIGAQKVTSLFQKWFSGNGNGNIWKLIPTSIFTVTESKSDDYCLGTGIGNFQMNNSEKKKHLPGDGYGNFQKIIPQMLFSVGNLLITMVELFDDNGRTLLAPESSRKWRKMMRNRKGESCSLGGWGLGCMTASRCTYHGSLMQDLLDNKESALRSDCITFCHEIIANQSPQNSIV